MIHPKFRVNILFFSVKCGHSKFNFYYICGYVLWNMAADCKPKNSISSLSSFTAMFMWTFLFSDNAQTTFNAWQLTWPAWGLRPGLCYLWVAAGTDLRAWCCPIQSPPLSRSHNTCHHLCCYGRCSGPHFCQSGTWSTPGNSLGHWKD